MGVVVGLGLALGACTQRCNLPCAGCHPSRIGVYGTAFIPSTSDARLSCIANYLSPGEPGPPFTCGGNLPVGSYDITVSSAEGRRAIAHLDVDAPDCCGCVRAASEIVNLAADAGLVDGG